MIRGSVAEKAGLEVGDVILQVNDEAVLTRDAAREALGEVATDRPLQSDRAARGGGSVTLSRWDRRT